VRFDRFDPGHHDVGAIGMYRGEREFTEQVREVERAAAQLSAEESAEPLTAAPTGLSD
jgi:hypothetical protein